MSGGGLGPKSLTFSSVQKRLRLFRNSVQQHWVQWIHGGDTPQHKGPLTHKKKWRSIQTLKWCCLSRWGSGGCRRNVIVHIDYAVPALWLGGQGSRVAPGGFLGAGASPFTVDMGILGLLRAVFPWTDYAGFLGSPGSSTIFPTPSPITNRRQISSGVPKSAPSLLFLVGGSMALRVAWCCGRGLPRGHLHLSSHLCQ